MIETKIESHGNIPKCINGIGQDNCYTIAYSVIGQKEDWIDHSLDFVAFSNNLSRKDDIIELDFA